MSITMKLCTDTVALENLWDIITAHQGHPFFTKKGLPFTYYVRGGELFADRRERSITKSTFEKAYQKLLEDQTGENPPRRINGPKTLNVFGAPYVWAVFLGIGLIEEEYSQQELMLMNIRGKNNCIPPEKFF